MNLRPVLYALGIILSTLAISMALPMLVDLYHGNDDWKVFFLCILATAFFGGAMVLSNGSREPFSLSIRQAFLLTTSSWLAMAAFGCLPLWFSGLGLNFTDAFFEAMSGITTTGATVIVGLDHAPPGILLWRALIQWLGGIGIIVLALSILPFLKVGGMQLFRTESSDKQDKALPRAAKLASSIGYIYVFLTFICTVLYYTAGMTLFDAVSHAMTTISTGGFGNYDSSLMYYNDVWIETIAMTFMIMGALPFVLYLQAAHGNVMALWRDAQVRWFMAVIIISSAALMFHLINQFDTEVFNAFRQSIFSIVSITTGTGFTTHDYSQWGGFAVSLLFFLMVVGGCAGSTSCGIKVFRFQVLQSVANVQIKKLLYPHGVFIPHYGNKPLSESVQASVMGFFFMYALCFAALSTALSFVGLDFLTAMSGAAAAISNVGPGMGDIIGPAGNFRALPDSAKWLLCGGMLLGRLEIFTVLVLFAPGFWRR